MCRATTRSVRIDLRTSEKNRARLMMPQVLERGARDVTDVRFGSKASPGDMDGRASTSAIRR
jgi:hypothetical protein